MPLKLPAFNIYKPRRIKQLEERIIRDDRAIDITFDNDRIEKALDKLRHGLPLTRKDNKILCFHLEKVIFFGLLEVFLPQIYGFFDKASHYPAHLKGLMVSYYDLFKNEEVFRLLQYAVKKTAHIKETIQLATDMVNKSQDTNSFLINMYHELGNSASIAELNEISELYLLGQNKKMYISIVQLIIARNIQTVNSSEAAEYLIDLMNEINDVNILKPLFERFLLLFKDVQFFENQEEYLNQIFQYIGDRMGDPYKSGRARWIGISQDAIDIYTLWQTQKNIKYFFGDIAGDYDRLQFWKRYSHYFIRVEYISKLSGAILMESKKHMFVEFAVVGAMYMFRREIQNIDQVENYTKRYNNTDSIQKLKDRNKCAERLIHTRHTWQSNFSYTLENYGYIARG